MQTLLDLDDTLLAQAAALAAREHTSLNRLIEEALHMRLAAATPARPPLPVYAGQGGLHPAVTDPTRNRALLDAADSGDEA